jgi:hypothetical protein
MQENLSNPLSDISGNINNQDQSQSMTLNNKPKSKTLIISCGIFVILVVMIAGSVFFFAPNLLNPTKPNEALTTKNNISKETNLPLNENLNIETKDVSWFKEPKEVEGVGLFAFLDTFLPYRYTTGSYPNGDMTKFEGVDVTEMREPKTKYYQVGIMKSKYEGSPVFISITQQLPTTNTFKTITTDKDITYTRQEIYLFIKTTEGKFILTKDYFNKSIGAYIPSDKVDQVSQDDSISLDDSIPFHANEPFALPNSKISLVIDDSKNYYFFRDLSANKNLYLVKDLGQGYELYSEQDINNNEINIETTLPGTTLVLKRPSGIVSEASISHKIFLYQSVTKETKKDTTIINWESSDKPRILTTEFNENLMKNSKHFYTYEDTNDVTYAPQFDGCDGNLSDFNNISMKVINKSTDLQSVATTSEGESIYDIKNKDIGLFDQFYQAKVSGSLDQEVRQKLNYEYYLDLKPILVLKNNAGIYEMLFRQDLVQSKCWAEPLIYLYPQERTDIQISLSKNINLTDSSPKHLSTWKVTAYPDGKIFDKASDRWYQYLYWEGLAPLNEKPVIVNVIDKNNIHTYLEGTLKKLGLNGKEVGDFEAYWEPKLTQSPYYLLSFYDKSALDKIAPLEINPKPDTSIRVLMTYQGLTSPIEVKNMEESYVTPQRKGFTLVEWGGILQEAVFDRE